MFYVSECAIVKIEFVGKRDILCLISSNSFWYSISRSYRNAQDNF